MTAPEPATGRATVIGAGLVGLATALYLRRAGFEVRLIERDEPGQGASYGNAGVIAVDSVVPVAMPGILRRVPRMLLDSRSPLAVRWSYLPRLTPWLIRFLAASRPAEVERISIALRQICERAMAAYRPLLDDGEAAALVRHGGWLAVYESDAGFADDQPAWSSADAAASSIMSWRSRRSDRPNPPSARRSSMRCIFPAIPG